MIKLSHIVPIKFIKDYSGDFIMVLANYLDPEIENEYEKVIKETKLPLVLDNGVFEIGKADGIDNLMRKAKRLNPVYIFTPDTLFDTKQTRSGYEIFKYIQEKQGTKFRIGVIIQADNEEDYLKEFIEYNNDPEVSVIGLSYLAISHSIKYKIASKVPKSVKERKKDAWNVFKDADYTEDRIKMLKKIEQLDLKKIKPLHLLGIGKSYADLIYAQKLPYYHYNDTSTCYMTAKKGLILTDNLEVPGGKIKDKINIYDNPGPMIKQLLEININKVESVLCHK